MIAELEDRTNRGRKLKDRHLDERPLYLASLCCLEKRKDYTADKSVMTLGSVTPLPQSTEYRSPNPDLAKRVQVTS